MVKIFDLNIIYLSKSKRDKPNFSKLFFNQGKLRPITLLKHPSIFLIKSPPFPSMAKPPAQLYGSEVEAYLLISKLDKFINSIFVLTTPSQLLFCEILSISDLELSNEIK